MEIKILTVGKIKDRAYLEKIEDYASRIKHDAKLEIVEIKDAGMEREGEKIIDHLKNARARIVALDERGKAVTSVGFAQKLAAAGGPVVFVIGGPGGLSEAVKTAAHERLSLSAMTFTHEMARLLLLEQIYRAISIIKNRKYHKE